MQGTDSTFRGRRIEGFDRLDSERDPFSRAFNAAVNDLGLAGDVVDSLTVIEGSVPFVRADVPICALNTVRGVGQEADVVHPVFAGELVPLRVSHVTACSPAMTIIGYA